MTQSALSDPRAAHESELPAAAPSTKVRGAGGVEFPLRFSVRSKSEIVKQLILQLGDLKSKHFFTVTWQTSWSGKTTLGLSNASATAKDPPIATAESAGLLTQTATMHLPGGIREQLQGHRKLKSSTFSFVIPVPQAGGDTFPERFEWRQSHGAEIQGISSSKAWGYKLVRMSKDGPKGYGGGRKERGDGEASDGREVVAVWADCVKTSESKLAYFEFRGSGITGELGEDWTLMAVLSILHLWVGVGSGMLQGYG